MNELRTIFISYCILGSTSDIQELYTVVTKQLTKTLFLLCRGFYVVQRTKKN